MSCAVARQSSYHASTTVQQLGTPHSELGVTGTWSRVIQLGLTLANCIWIYDQITNDSTNFTWLVFSRRAIL